MKYSLDNLEQRLRYVRKKILAMTQDEFADALEVSRDVISRYETGKTKLPAKQVLRITELANISVDWLLAGRGDMPMQSKEGLSTTEVVASRINTLEGDLNQLRKILKGDPQDIGAELQNAENAAFTKTSDVISALTELEIHFRNLTENPPIGEVIIQDGNIKYVNDNFMKALGYKSENLVNKSVWELVHPEDRERIQQVISRRLKGKNPAPDRYRVYKSDGEVVNVWSSGTKVDYEGRPAIAEKVMVLDEWNKLGQSLEHLKALLYKEFIKT